MDQHDNEVVFVSRRSQRSGAAQKDTTTVQGVQVKPAGTNSKHPAVTVNVVKPGRAAAGDTAYSGRPRSSTARKPSPAAPSARPAGDKASAPRRSAQPARTGAGVRHKKKRSRMPKWVPALMSVCAIALMGVGYVGWNQVGDYMDYLQKSKELAQETFYDGITLEGQPLSGMTLFDAIDSFTKQLNTASASTNITVTANGQTFTITQADVQLSANLQSTLNLAYSTGRSGSFDERYATLQQLADDGMDFSVDRGWNEASLRAKIDEIASAVYVKAQNASVADFDTATGKFTFASEVTGYKLDEDDLYEQLTAAIADGNVSASIEARIDTVAPEYDVAYMNEHFGRISAATTTATSNTARNTNLKLASEAFNGMVIQPGETVSFNETTGQRTASKGYQEANAYSSGVVVMELGGGVCQVSSTLYNAVVKADLGIVERSPHSRVSSYVDIGLDAAVNWPSQDFKFKNTSDYPVYIVASFSDLKLTFKIYGYQLDDGVYIKLSSEKTSTVEPKEGTRTMYDSSIPEGEQVTEAAREGARAQSYKNYYDADGNLIKTEELDTSYYPASQYTVRIGTGS